MRPSRLLPLALALIAGCSPSPEPPAAPKAKAAEPDRLAVGSIMQLHDASAPVVKVFTRREQMIEVPVGSKAQILEDSSTITQDPGARLIHVKVEDGPRAGTVGHVNRSELRPAPKP